MSFDPPGLREACSETELHQARVGEKSSQRCLSKRENDTDGRGIKNSLRKIDRKTVQTHTTALVFIH
jgi:hypothetical protein